MAPRSSAAAGRLLPLLLLALLLSSAALLVAVVEAVPRLDASVGEDLDSRRPSAESSPDAIAAAARERGTPLDDLTAFWLENADELRARDARLSPEARAQELARRETEWRNAARRKEQAERMEREGDEDEEEEEREGKNKSLKEMERERKKFKKEEKDGGKDSATEQEGNLDPGVIDSATLYSPPKATAFRAQGDAPAKISLGKMLTEGYDPKAGGRGLAPGSARFEEDDLPRMVLNTFDLMEEGDEEDRPKYSSPSQPPPNAFGARPNDVPVVAPTPIDLSAAARPKTPLEASRLVLNDTGADVWGFAAVSSADQPLRRYRPPDQGLCAGNGIVIAGNNLVYRAFNASDGAVLQGPIAPQDFYGMGGDMSDPVCVYDAADTKRFYLGMFQWGGGGKSGEPKYSRFMVAVSRSSDPVRDGWDGPFLVRNDGLDQKGKSLPGLESCGRAGGCMGDYPTIGMDKNSLWVGFNLFGSGYDGVLVLAISKKSLIEAKKREPAAVAYSNWPGELAFTVHPTTTQAGSQSSPGPKADSGGAIFLVSTGPATQNDPSRNEVALWAATDTAALAVEDFPARDTATGEPRLPKLSAPALVPVPAYRDVGAFVGAKLVLDQPSPGIPLDGGDGRTAQAVFSGGLIWGAAQTAMHIGNADSPLVIGVVYWAFEPLWKLVDAANASLGYSFVPKLVATGYVGAGPDTALTGDKPGKTHVGRPAITASARGTAWVGAILTGLGTNPTAVAVEVDLFEGPRAMHVGAIAPTVLYPLSPDEKGTPGYLRGGDYSAAALGDGGATAWMSSQWAGGTSAKSCYKSFDASPGGVGGGLGASTCPSWGTWVSRAKVEVGGPSAAERVAAARRKTGGGGGGATAVGPAGAPPSSPSSPSSFSAAPSPSGAPPASASAESFGGAEFSVFVAKEAAAPVNRPSVEEKKEDGKEREEEKKEREEERERREEKEKEKNGKNKEEERD